MSDEILDEYLRLTNPDLCAAFQAIWEESPLFNLTPEQAEEIQFERWRQHLSTFDQSVLGEVGLKVDDLIARRYQRLKERAGGSASPQSAWRVKQRERALLAIHEADKAGMRWGEAIASALQASQSQSREEINRKTVDRWLRKLHGWGLISMEPPPARRRGRPPKKGIGG
jgi:hypothetical protein